MGTDRPDSVLVRDTRVNGIMIDDTVLEPTTMRMAMFIVDSFATESVKGEANWSKKRAIMKEIFQTDKKLVEVTFFFSLFFYYR